MRRSLNPAPPGALTSSSTALRLSFFFVVLTIIALALVAYLTERGIAASRDSVIHTYQVRSQLNNLQLEITRAQINEAGSLFAGEGEQADLARHSVDELRRLTRDNAREQKRLDQLGQILNERFAIEKHPASAGRMQPMAGERTRDREKERRDRDKRIDSIVSAMQDEEELLLAHRLKSWDDLFERNVLMLGLAFAVVTVMVAHKFRALSTEVAQTKDTEKRVRDNAKSYRLMSARILELQDSERRRVARELHDSVGQYLAGLKINLSRLESGGRIDARQLIRETIGLTDCAIQEVRTMSHLLHPPLLDEIGFLPAARWYVDEYGKRSQLKVSLLVDEPIGRLPKEVETALFRVLQETLTNVYRHAEAQSVDIRIVCRDGHVTLTVADDGKGIPEGILARFRGGAALGIGLAGMRERLAEFGGEMNVESSSGGVVVEAMIPTKACVLSESR